MVQSARDVRVLERSGTVAELHAADLFADRTCDSSRAQSIDVVVCRPTDVAIALGSRQRPEILDAAACERAGVSIARRRSGGGAVLIEPASIIWIDIVVPAGAVTHDVRGSMVEIGEHWAAAVAPVIAADAVTVHTGGMVETPWSDLVCFAGFGPGEVLVAGRKLVGLSQRRTRHGARFQGMVHLRLPAIALGSLFAGAVPETVVPAAAVAPELDAGELAVRLAASLGAG